MAKAIWNGKIVAESKRTKEIDGILYFPPKSVKREFLKKSHTQFVSKDKGKANYYNVAVEDKISWNGAWIFSEPNDEIKSIGGFFAFSHGIEVKD
jgi:uncharacterized protein (DUF427 family)